MREINLLKSFPKSKSREGIITSCQRTEENKKIAKKFDKEFFDGERINGYGGLKYDGRWREVVSYMKELYHIDTSSSVLDIGCAKGYFLFDLQDIIPNITFSGLDISEYAINHAMSGYANYLIKTQGLNEDAAQILENESRKKILPHLIIGSADNLPWADNTFDVVIAVNTIHNLPRERCKKALEEMVRVCKNKENMFLTVDSYKTLEDKERMDKWVLTAEIKMLVMMEIIFGL